MAHYPFYPKDGAKVLLFCETTKYSRPRNTFESVLHEHIAAVVRKIACGSQGQPPSAAYIAEPVGRVAAVLAPPVEQHLERKVRVAVMHPCLQTVTEPVESDFLLLFHNSNKKFLLAFALI